MSPPIVILGGGPAGATTALVLARLGLEVVVLEAASGPRVKPGECLSPSLLPLLDQLGLRDELLAEAHLPSHGNRSLWGSDHPIDEDFIFGVHGPGLHIDRCRFEEDLAEAARRRGVDWRYGVRVVDCQRTARGWTLETREGSERGSLEACFVVDASGRQAVLARRMGARRVRHDRLVGLTTLLKGRTVEDSFTLLEAVESGWWYSASLTDGRLAIAYMTDTDLLNASKVREPGGWAKMVSRLSLTAERIERCLGVSALDSLTTLEGSLKLRVLPAESSRLTSIIGDDWLAVGDAAAAYDPLSSYGIASAMGSGYYAARAIHDHLSHRRDALLAYVHILEKAYTLYLDLLREGYAMEQRWAGARFWKRRL